MSDHPEKPRTFGEALKAVWDALTDEDKAALDAHVAALLRTAPPEPVQQEADARIDRALLDSLKVGAVNAGDEIFEKHGMRFMLRPAQCQAILDALQYYHRVQAIVARALATPKDDDDGPGGAGSGA